MVSAPAWDGTGCGFDSWQCQIYIPCSLSLRLLGPFGVLWDSEYTWLVTQIVLKNYNNISNIKHFPDAEFNCLIQRLFPNQLVWSGRTSNHHTLFPAFPWMDNWLNGRSKNGSVGKDWLSILCCWEAASSPNTNYQPLRKMDVKMMMMMITMTMTTTTTTTTRRWRRRRWRWRWRWWRRRRWRWPQQWRWRWWRRRKRRRCWWWWWRWWRRWWWWANQPGDHQSTHVHSPGPSQICRCM